MVKELAVFDILHDQEEMPRGLDDFVELDDTGVADQFEDVYLSRHSFHISYVDYFLFHQYFDSYFLASEGVGCEFDFTEGALTDSFAKQVVAYFFLLLLFISHLFL